MPDGVGESSGEVDLGHLNPVAPTAQNLGILADHARQVMDRCGKPMLLENIATHLSMKGTMPEPEFLNRLCDAADDLGSKFFNLDELPGGRIGLL